MSGGLIALLDDIAVIARVAATSLDDVGVVAGKASVKAAGVVIDDAAVTPSYVTGLTPARELPIIWKIFKGSLINKLVFLLPGALLLSSFLPQAIVVLLLLGGLYLCYEGAEKVIEKLGGAHHGETLEDDISDLAAFEEARVKGAVRTDLILSAEIMAISLSEIAAVTDSFWTLSAALALVAIGITVAVYGAVGFIVKMDDIGLYLARKQSPKAQLVGGALVQAMPLVLNALSFIGTIAMLWVGGGIILHSLHELGIHGPEEIAETLASYAEVAGASLSVVTGWLAYAGLSALFGLVVGAIVAGVLHKILRIKG